MTPFVDLARAGGQLDDPRFFRVIPKGVALTVAGLAALSAAVIGLVGWMMPDTMTLPLIGAVGFLDTLASWAAVGIMLLLSVVLMVPVAALVVGFFLDEIAEAVEARHYPHLPAVTPLPLSAQVVDGAKFLGVVVAANAVAVVGYLALPPLAPLVFWGVNGYLLGREYFQLVATRRLGPAGAAALRRRHAARIWLTGTAMAVPLSGAAAQPARPGARGGGLHPPVPQAERGRSAGGLGRPSRCQLPTWPGRMIGAVSAVVWSVGMGWAMPAQ
jgi:CysZ protein